MSLGFQVPPQKVGLGWVSRVQSYLRFGGTTGVLGIYIDPPGEPPQLIGSPSWQSQTGRVWAPCVVVVSRVSSCDLSFLWATGGGAHRRCAARGGPETAPMTGQRLRHRASWTLWIHRCFSSTGSDLGVTWLVSLAPAYYPGVLGRGDWGVHLRGSGG